MTSLLTDLLTSAKPLCFHSEEKGATPTPTGYNSIYGGITLNGNTSTLYKLVTAFPSGSGNYWTNFYFSNFSNVSPIILVKYNGTTPTVVQQFTSTAFPVVVTTTGKAPNYSGFSVSSGYATIPSNGVLPQYCICFNYSGTDIVAGNILKNTQYYIYSAGDLGNTCYAFN